MLSKLFRKIFKTQQDRDLEILWPFLEKINSLEEKYRSLEDAKLKEQTQILRGEYEAGESLESLLPRAFATVREASRRVLGLRPYDVQILGGIALHFGNIVEMKTGEGKTLTATMPLYLNALTRKGVNLVTVNDYLAHRDSKEMGKIYEWLGLSVGLVVSNIDDMQRKSAYAADITYGTNQEFAFDHLRDNMKYDVRDYVQREPYFCIVDEVDSVLIDEARTPMLISGQLKSDTSLYFQVNNIVRTLQSAHFHIDEKARTAFLSSEGIDFVQKQFGIDNLYDISHLDKLHHVIQSLKAHFLFRKEVDYIVKEKRVIVIDEHTGRLKEGSRWSDGLHQSIEAKEGLPITSENQTLATITFQNFFRQYPKLSGMTGTAESETLEFMKIYGLDVVIIPPNVPMIREDQPDIVFGTKKEKLKAVIDSIIVEHKKGRPVLVGTTSVESSQTISTILSENKINHQVLNAKNHAREAEILALAGNQGSVTIATNMAGRGTDIKLSEEARALGGLFVIGTERHESRRVDNQLRGRSGRQGDPGTTRFVLSMEDDLLRIFGSEKVKNAMKRMGIKEGEAIDNSMITKVVANAQRKIEIRHFDLRKHLLEFDNVLHEQRQIIYELRKSVLKDEGNRELVAEFIEETSGPEVQTELQKKFENHERRRVDYAYREILITSIDRHWRSHLIALEQLKEGIGLKSYGHKNPLIEFKRDAYNLYEEMKIAIKHDVINRLRHIKIVSQKDIDAIQREIENEKKKKAL